MISGVKRISFVLFCLSILYCGWFGTDAHASINSEKIALKTIASGKDSLSFLEITTQAGIDDPLGGHSVVFTDVNGDSLPDVYFTMIYEAPTSDRFYVNREGNKFQESAALFGIDDYDGGSHGACFADLDNDGDYDLINGTTDGVSGEPGINNIYENIGNNQFRDVTASCGILTRDWETRGVTVFDFDNDGDLDIFFVTNYQGSNDPVGERNEIYRNEGNLTFTPLNFGELYTCPAGQGVTAVDYDGDGDIDLFTGNRYSAVNILRNDGGDKFELVDPSSIGINHKAGDGITFADVDNDGILDVMLTSDNEGHLYRGLGDGMFSYLQSFSNTDGYMAAFPDLDNDGDVDVVFSGDDVCYLNDGAGRFTPGPAIIFKYLYDPRAIGLADIDNDGDIDFAYGCKRSNNILIRNNFNGGNWIKIALISVEGQAGAFGAKVRVYPAGQAVSGQLIGMQQAQGAYGYLGQNDPVLHFGLGTHDSIDVVVDFLDGTRIIQAGISANQRISIDARTGLNRRYYLDVRNGTGSGYYRAGDIIPVQARPAPAGFLFAGWTGDNTSVAVPVKMSTSVLMPNERVKIVAHYKRKPVEIDQFGVCEIKLNSTKNYPNPYKDTQVEAIFHGPSDIYNVNGFWDGDSTFKIRFSPNESGEWSVETRSADTNLHLNATFDCVQSSLSGGIATMNGYPYHFQTQDGIPFWWFGETCWNAMSTNAAENLTHETYEEYVRVRAEQDFNYLQVLLLHDGNWGGVPFIGDTGELVNPVFWQEVDRRIAFANANGLQCGLVLAWKHGGDDNTDDWEAFEDTNSRKAFCQYIASRYGAYNVVWILAGEYNELGSDKNVITIDEWSQLAETLQQFDPHHRLLGMHAANTAEELADLPWISFGDYMQTYNQLHAAVLNSRDHQKPVINAEYAYYLRDSNGDGIVDKPNSATRDEFRYASWDIAMAGGYFVSGFGTTYLGGLNDPNPFDVHDPRNDDAELDLQYLRTFFTALDWWKYQPADQLVSGTGIHYCLSDQDSHYVVYVRGTIDSVQLNADRSTSGTFVLKRFNPRDGKWTLEHDVTNDSLIIITPPDSNDWVYYLARPAESISGSIIYYAGYQLIPNVSVVWTTDSTTIDTITADQFGKYSFGHLSPYQDYHVQCSKQAESDLDNVTITAYDAALTYQAAMGSRNLTAFQRIAADVDLDSTITASDAAQIAAYSVGIWPIIGSHVGEWTFSPNEYIYQPLDSTRVAQNFVGIIRGNVHGGWGKSTNTNTLVKDKTEVTEFVKIDHSDLHSDLIIHIPAGQNTISVDLELEYQPSLMHVASVNRTSLTMDFEIKNNQTENLVRVGLYGVQPIDQAGDVLIVRLSHDPEMTEQQVTEAITINKLFINCQRIIDNSIFLSVNSDAQQPVTFRLEQNYPNPFGAVNAAGTGLVKTYIGYQIPRPGHVTLKIFNYIGQEICILVNENKSPGKQQVVWDGRNSQGVSVAAGIYFYQLSWGSENRVKKLVLLR